METKELQAGRELDALIAEKVMGFKVKVYPSQHEGRPPCVLICRKSGGSFNAPHYSTDIAAAWLVVEKLRADGVFAWVGADPSGDCYHASFHWANGEKWDIHQSNADAPTAALAICRAALKAVPQC